MEFGTPSRFLKDIDPSLLVIEGEDSYREMGQHQSYGSSSFGSRMQNSRPVATQFRADMKPKITSYHQPEPPVDPFSESFKRQLAQAEGNFRRLRTPVASSGSSVSSSGSSVSSSGSSVSSSGSSVSSSGSSAPLHEGNVIEHQRFGIGTVIKVEGTGENTKATVEFRNTGTKQLLLKFAKYTIVG